MDMVLVFTRTKHGADRVARKLESVGITTGTLHANRSQNQRLRALADFRSGAIRVLIATDIASRGIDVDGISHVVNFDFPPQVEDYVHRIGRTGRANAIGDAISFICEDDHGSLRSLERFIGRGIVRKRAEGFDYAAPEPAVSSEERNRGRGGPPRGGRSNSTPGAHGGGDRGHRRQESRPPGRGARNPGDQGAGPRGQEGKPAQVRSGQVSRRDANSGRSQGHAGQGQPRRNGYNRGRGR
jgi:ATP-dependent RNA helicase RhlE